MSLEQAIADLEASQDQLNNSIILIADNLVQKVDSAEKGVANGVATLDTTGKVPAAQLPSYVDDVLEFTNLASFPATGETGKIYVAMDTNKTYRWSGTAYVYITSGAVDSVAGKTGVVTLVKGDVGLGNVDNTADSAKAVRSATKLATARTIATTGDVIGTGTSFDGSVNISIPLTLSNSGVTAGTYNNSATAVKPIIVDAKGRITGVGADVTITPSFSSITSKPTTISGYGITNAYTNSQTDTLLAGKVSSNSLSTAITAMTTSNNSTANYISTLLT